MFKKKQTRNVLLLTNSTQILLFKLLIWQNIQLENSICVHPTTVFSKWVKCFFFLEIHAGNIHLWDTQPFYLLMKKRPYIGNTTENKSLSFIFYIFLSFVLSQSISGIICKKYMEYTTINAISITVIHLCSSSST